MGIRKIIRPAIFLDRDGVLNPTILNPATGRMEALLHPADFRLFDSVIPALQRLQGTGFPLILVSNQPNYALGKVSYDIHRRIRDKLAGQLASAGIRFTRFCYCLHHPKGLTPGYSFVCGCRKPAPGSLLQARDDFGLTLRDSWMIGDQPADTQCGHAAGVRTIRIAPATSGPGTPLQSTDPCADYFARDLAEATDIILETNGRRTTTGFHRHQRTGVDLVGSSLGIPMKHLHSFKRILL
jgi:D-glycero-D-manno-heptose 1,7-bisphosphate phosphatase